MGNKQSTTKDLDFVHTALKVCKTFDLETEVVLFALRNLKEDPKLTIEEAMTDAMNEWIK